MERTRGQIAFEAYSAAGEHDGRPMLPPWDKVSDVVREAWEAAGAAAAADRMREYDRDRKAYQWNQAFCAALSGALANHQIVTSLRLLDHVQPLLVIMATQIADVAVEQMK